MDGNKKITMFVFVGVVVLSIAACKVQSPHYVSLYLDNPISVNDTTEPGETPLDKVDTVIAHVVDTTAVIEAELPVFLRPAEDVLKLPSNSVYQLEVKELLKAITDSIHLLRHQMTELQNQLVEKPDMNFTGEKIQRVQPLYSPQPEVELKQLLQTKNDTIDMLRRQGFELRKHASIKADTVYVIKETAKSPVAVSQQPDDFIKQLLRAKDEQIQMLQSQLNVMQNDAARMSQPSYTTREPEELQPLDSQQPDHLTLQFMEAKNDTIQLLRRQLYNLQLHAPKKDTVIIEKEFKETQHGKEFVTGQKTSDLFKALQDTIRLLNTRVLSLEEQIIAGRDTPALGKQDEKDVPYETITDTTLLAFYEPGEIKPLKEESILQQIEELCRDKDVTKITLSGYTDSSGGEIINKEITALRINYLSDLIIPWIAKEKVFFQNFGDTFASDMVVSDERRIEIRIHTK